ncbi:uncharacterized protein LOC126367426 [Pectinophora gossypiella]|uniref:uncharacterized protein LOC126367426 n=1 Tax=Pectinophora gossypiella TaxID=13191 RepID=UPI00214EC30C|nr:uncharacterized protein LOC126367426 [Pectinophora gossypiella]
MALKIQGEAKLDSDPCVVAWDNALFVGTEDGSIKVFDAKLTPGASWAAHSVQLFALAAGNGKVYSSSNDGGIRVWTQKGEKIKELPKSEGSEGDTGILHVFGKELYAGDETGNVTVYQDDELKALYNVLEEVKDLWLEPPFLFTVRDLDVTVTEIKPDESKTRFVTRHTMEGRAPLRITGNRLLVMARGGNDLQLHDASIDTTFKKLHAVKASDMIVTSLAVSGDFAWTGGWDSSVRRWKIDGDVLQPAGELNLGSYVNGLVATAPDNVYAILTGGRIVNITAA